MCSRSTTWVALFLAMAGLTGLGKDLRAQTPNLESCSAPGLDISGNLPPTVDVISVPNSLPVGDVQVTVDITHTFIGDLNLEISSPAAVTALLKQDVAAGGAYDDILVIFDEGGIDYSIGILDFGFHMKPETPGTIDALVAATGDAQGDWTLTVTDTFGGDDGVLNEWCLRVFENPSPPPPLQVEGLTCSSPPGSGAATLTWSNPVSYDEIQILVNGVLDATLPGSATSHVTAPQPLPTSALIEVVTVSVLETGVPRRCLGEIVDSGNVQECLFSGAAISGNSPPILETVTVGSPITVGDAWVTVDATHTWSGDVILAITSPLITEVTLKQESGVSINDVLVTFDDNGVPYDPDFIPDGLHMRPQGPGTLSDFIGQDAAGDWTLRVEDQQMADDGVLNGWCLTLFEGCGVPAPGGVTCTESGGDVMLAWTVVGSPNEIQVYRNGALIASLPGIAETYTDASAPPGVLTYEVAAVGPCTSFSTPCSVEFGITDVIFAGELPSLVDSVAELEAALIANGKGVKVVDGLTHAAVGTPNRLWVCLGTYPDSHEVTPDDGLFLAELTTGDLGLDGTPDQDPTPIYIEGPDLWGFEIPTVFYDYDGILGLEADGNIIDDGDDTLTDLIGATSGFGVDLTGLDAPYAQDQAGNDFTDRLVPTTFFDPVYVADLAGGDAGPIWTYDDSGTLVTVGVFYDSIFAPVIDVSWEFGGYGGDRVELALRYLQALGGPDQVGPSFIRGDANGDELVEISDAIFVLTVLFSGGTTTCPLAMDANDDDTPDISDAIFLLSFLFSGGDDPPAPFPDCGEDPTPGSLACDPAPCSP